MTQSISGIGPPKDMFEARAHGQASLMQLCLMRNKAVQASPTNQDIVGTVNRTLLSRDLECAGGPPLGIYHWSDTTYRSWLDEAATRVTALAARACAHWRGLHDADCGLTERWHRVRRCWNALESTHQLIETYYDSAPPQWRWQVGESNVAAAYPPRLDVYPTPVTAHLWNAIRYAHLHVLQKMLQTQDLIRTLQQPPRSRGEQTDLPTQARSDLHDRFTDILGDMASSAHVVMEGTCLWMDPCCIPLMNQQFLLWQLQKVYNHIDLPGHVRDWVTEVCRRIGRGGFIRQGLLVDSAK